MPRPRPKHHHRAIFYPNIAGVEGPDTDGRGFGHTQAWHKTTWDASPYCVPNELICAEIGKFLRLPIPPFGVTYGSSRQYFFTTLNFNFDRKEVLPPIDPDVTWSKLPELCTGVVLFDVLIANSDRHDNNLAVNKVGNPTALIVFDHDQALFGGGFPLQGESRLAALQDRLGISQGDVTQGNRHCLLDVIDPYKWLDKWFHRIMSIPDWFIDDVCKGAAAYGLSKSEVLSAQEFLKFRKRRLDTIVKKHASEFTKATRWPGEGELFS